MRWLPDVERECLECSIGRTVDGDAGGVCVCGGGGGGWG